MKLTCVGLGPVRCLLLHLRKTCILLDCGLWDPSSAAAYVKDQQEQALQQRGTTGMQPPAAGQAMQGESKEEQSRCSGGVFLMPFYQLLALHDIEAVLLSTAQSLLALPALLALYPQLIQGPIYATVAALDVARHMAEELLAHASHAVGGLPCQPPLGQDQLQLYHAALVLAGVPWPAGSEPVVASCLLPLPSRAQVEACFARVKCVRYGQPVSLDGLELTAQAFPSGSGMGHGQWRISDGCRSIGYMSDWALPSRPSDFLPLEPESLSHLDVLVLAPAALAAAAQGTKGAQGYCLQAVGQMVVATLRLGGTVLVPLPASGAAWHLIKEWAPMLQTVFGPHAATLVCCSPTAADSLAVANTSMEFLNRGHQARAYQAQPAFQFAALQASGALVVGQELSTPAVQAALHKGQCVLFAPPSVCLAALSSQQKATSFPHSVPPLSAPSSVPFAPASPPVLCVLCHSPGMEGLNGALRSAAGGLTLRVVACDVGAPPTAAQLAEVLGHLLLPPGQLVLSEGEAGCMEVALGLHPELARRMQCHAYSWLDRLSLKLPKHQTTLNAAPEALQGVQWAPMQQETAHVADAAHAADYVTARLSAVLQFEEGSWALQPLASAAQPSLTAAAAAALNVPSGLRLVGQPQLPLLLAALAAEGLQVQQSELWQPGQEGRQAGAGAGHAATELQIPGLDAVIRLQPGTVRVTAPDPGTEQAVMDLIVAATVRSACESS